MSKLTDNQKIVLKRLARHDTVFVGMAVREFSDVATVTSGRREWAGRILKRLDQLGLVEKGARMRGCVMWRITEAGLEAINNPNHT